MNLPTTTTGNEDYSQPLTLLFMAYETKNETREAGQLKAAAYKEAMKGLPYWCVEQAVQRFNSGQIDRKNPDFRPSPEAVAKEARRLLDEEKVRQENEARRRRLAKMDQGRPTPGPGLAPFEKNAEKAAEKMRGRTVLEQNISHAAFASRRDWPAGATWFGGKVYAPEGVSDV